MSEKHNSAAAFKRGDLCIYENGEDYGIFEVVGEARNFEADMPKSGWHFPIECIDNRGWRGWAHVDTLRLQPKGENKPHRRAYWVDNSVPDLTEEFKKCPDVDVAAFSSWIAPNLGDFRGVMSMREATPPRAEEAKQVAEFCEHLAGIQRYFLPGAMPATIEKYLQRLALHDHDPDLIERLRADIDSIEWAANQANTQLKVMPAKRGRKRSLSRDKLLAAVIEKLQSMGVNNVLAPNVASGILRRCNIYAPMDEGSTRNAARRSKPKASK